MSAWSPDDAQRRAHPELVQFAAVDHQLTMLSAVLADVHGGNGRSAEAKDQARSLVGVIHVLRAQIEAYRLIVDMPRPAERRLRR